MGRRWTEEEDRFLRENYPARLCTDLARHLGRETGVVRRRVSVLGLKRYASYPTSELDKRIIVLHSQGYSDRGIAQRTGVGDNKVWRVRQRLKLAPNKVISEARSVNHREALRRREQDSGERINDVKKKLWADFAISHGWPDHFNPRRVQLMHLIGQIALEGTFFVKIDDILSRFGGSKASLRLHLRPLVEEGFLICITGLDGNNRTGSPNHYCLSQEALTIMEQTAQKYESMITPELDLVISRIAGRFARQFGIEFDDLKQEAYLAVLSALPDFDASKGDNLKGFASVVAKRRLIKYTEQQNRKRMQSIEVEDDDSGEVVTLAIPGKESSPESVAELKDEPPRKLQDIQQTTTLQTAQKIGQLRQTLYDSIAESDIKEVMASVVEKAKGGNVRMIELLFRLVSGSASRVNQTVNLQQVNVTGQVEDIV